MNQIQWEEVKTGSLASLDRLVLSNSTSARRQGLRELREKILGVYPASSDRKAAAVNCALRTALLRTL